MTTKSEILNEILTNWRNAINEVARGGHHIPPEIETFALQMDEISKEGQYMLFVREPVNTVVTVGLSNAELQAAIDSLLRLYDTFVVKNPSLDEHLHVLLSIQLEKAKQYSLPAE